MPIFCILCRLNLKFLSNIVYCVLYMLKIALISEVYRPKTKPSRNRLEREGCENFSHFERGGWHWGGVLLERGVWTPLETMGRPKVIYSLCPRKELEGEQ